MALNLLLIDPCPEWLSTAKAYFEKQLYNVTFVSNGKDAQLALYNEKFFAVVLNIQVKNHSGLQVLKFIRTNYSSQKVILVTEAKSEDATFDDNDFTPEKLKKLGANEVIEIPFEFDELKGLLEGHQSIGEMLKTIPKKKGISEEEEVSDEDSTFTSVKIDEFYTSQAILFDIYIKLKSDRYIKILHAGDEFSKERLNKYKNEKKVEYLYFKKSDTFRYVKFNNHFAGKIIDNKKVPTASKAKLLQNVAGKFLEQTFEEGLKPQIIEQGKEIAENMYTMVQSSPDLWALLRTFQDFDPNAFTHAYLVSLFSTSIIKQFEWQSKTTIECTAMACFFHDIGKMKLPKEILGKKQVDFSAEELEQYRMHPEYGLEMVNDNALINNSIKQIILQHHEHYNGTGFPFNKKGSKILTLSNIVCLADDFVHIIQDEDLKPVDALKELLGRRDQLSWYNSLIVENLIKVFTDPEKITKNYSLPSNSRVVNKKAS